MTSPTVKTSGIVLGSVKYGEKSLIVSIFTEAFGRRAYLVNGVRGSKRKDLLPLTMPLTLVGMEAYNRPHTTLQRIKEMHLEKPFGSIPFSPPRRAIAMFMAELLDRSLRDEIPDLEMYHFINQSVALLDNGIEGESNFHLYFMLHLAARLGFAPDAEGANLPYFDLVEGIFVEAKPMHAHFLADADKHLWTNLLAIDIDNLSSLQLGRDERQRLIDIMQQYYMLHLPSFAGLKSHTVLHQIF